ncbi:hypothetical protein SDC9_161481 [bioreactor metagenome]|uniref:Secretion system C-terminal sorting domain-containing protein n=1 Tax=bioreactor metagenome TaxID=1076179 RepID=A0A645FIA3_9ZZZZ
MDATLENDKDVNVVNNISAISAKMVDKNVIYTAIDWRHLKNAGAFLAGIFNDAGDDFKKDDIILPIELVGFDATPIGRKVALNWTTASENNTSNFEVEKANVENSIIGLFSSVGTKQANGFTKSSSEYNLFDENVQYGNTYAYRLKINSFNGDYQYSPIKEVNIEYAGGASFGELTPNPASTVATMNYSLDKESNVRIALNDMTGKEIMTVFDGAVSAGSHKVSIDVTNLSTGIYHLVYIIDGKLINKPMMINVTK